MRVTASKRVEAGAENDVLRHVLLNGLGQLVFGVPAAGYHEGAKRSSKRVFAFSWTGAQFLGRLSPNNRYAQGIVEDFGLVKKLVGGASNGGFECGPAESSLLQRKLSCLRGGSPGIAFFTRTYIPQKLPGINAQFVAVIPMKLNGVFAHSLGRQGLGYLLEHRKRAGREFRSLAGMAARLAPLVVTKGAGTSIAQKGERVVRTVTVLPFDVQA
jgi:hypothetical protein